MPGGTGAGDFMNSPHGQQLWARAQPYLQNFMQQHPMNGGGGSPTPPVTPSPQPGQPAPQSMFPNWPSSVPRPTMVGPQTPPPAQGGGLLSPPPAQPDAPQGGGLLGGIPLGQPMSSWLSQGSQPMGAPAPTPAQNGNPYQSGQGPGGPTNVPGIWSY